MLVVLDSNILISALISTHGTPRKIFQAWREKRFELVTCREQIAELRYASRYPKLRAMIAPYSFGTMMNLLKQVPMLEAIPAKYSADDPGDAYLLNLSDAAKADYLVTGDKRAGLLQRRNIGRTRILTAAVFYDTMLRK